MKILQLIENRIAFQPSSPSWQEAIRAVGALLLQDGKVTKSYVEQMVQKVVDMGAYIILAPGVAMPHARPEDGVLETAAAILKLDQGVLFEEDPTPVRLFIALGATDPRGHLEAMGDLAQILSEENLLKKLFQAKTPEEVRDFFMQQEKLS